MEKRITIESAKEEIKAINNQMTLYMKKKKALQYFIEQETNRLMGVKSLKEEILDLYNDPKFIKEHGRKRYYWEIGNIVGYSQSSIQRIMNEEKRTI
jgi:hypothetical protein